MADSFGQRDGAYAHRLLGSDAENAVPPASTLAAQLVENLSSSSKLAKSEENRELDGFLQTIQRVADNPELLKTTNERIEHNHMISYVYTRAALDGIKLEDPVLNPNRVRNDALKAINFLRFSIKETPSLLNYKTTGQGFLFRGGEPLWVWLVPRLLRLLGHEKCEDLQGSIEGFLQYLQLTAARHGSLWGFAASFAHYLRATLSTLLDHLQSPSLEVSGKTSDTVILPPEFALYSAAGDMTRQPSQHAFYSLRYPTQMFRQAVSICTILAYPLISSDSIFEGYSSFSEDLLSLLDAWLDIIQVYRRLSSDSVVPPYARIMDILTSLIHRQNLLTVTTSNSILREKSCVLLALCCSELILKPQMPDGDSSGGLEARKSLCRALILLASAVKGCEATKRFVASKLIHDLSTLSMGKRQVSGDGHSSLDTSPASAETESDLSVCVTLLQDNLDLQSSGGERPMKAFSDNTLTQYLTFFFPPRQLPIERTSATKRRKMEDNENISILVDLAETLGQSARPAQELKGTREDHMVRFNAIDESSQCLALHELSSLACEVSVQSKTTWRRDPPVAKPCPCKDGQPPQKLGNDSPAVLQIPTVFRELVQNSAFLESKKPRIAAMVALRRVSAHSNEPSLIDLETSAAGQWCLQSLNSSLRELRIAAGRTLVAFLVRRADKKLDNLLARNRKNAIAILKSMSEKNRPHLVETCIMAWGQLGRAVDEEELNLVLLQLCDYLGSSNHLVSAFAFNELLKLAESRNVTPRQLFDPYWRSLAYLATKDMLQRPQRSRAFAELLQISVNELLVLIQTHALPWLVLDRRKEIIQRIAEARGESDVWRPLMDSSNLAAVLALLLAQESPNNTADFAKSRLEEISPHFQSEDMLSLLQSEPVLISMELLKAAGDSDANKKTAAREALQRMAVMVASANKEPKSKRSNVIGRFLQAYLLGLMARLTDVINDAAAIKPAVIEQRRCIRAVNEMIQLCGPYARIARPQISACLLSAVSQESLRQTAFECWAAMITHLEGEDVEAILETTFFIVTEHWAHVDHASQEVIRRMLRIICDRHAELLARNVSKLPSLSRLAGLEDVEAEIARHRPSLGLEEELEVFCERISHENSGVVYQALVELSPLLRNHQSALHATTAQRADSTMTRLLRKVLDCASRYTGTNTAIGRLCAECIGYIGCFDSNQVETVREQRSLIVLDNFETPDETTDFALFLIEVVLVPAFLSATDIKLQGFLSYAMQELLERCDIKAACAMQGTRMSEGASTYRKWIALPENVQEVVTPFLTSRYLVQQMEPVMVEYPIFRPGRSYGNWLRSFVIDMLRKGQNAYADMVFEPLTRVIRVKDLSTAEFLLPYLALHILLGARSTQKEKASVLGEMLAILQYQPPEDASHQVKEDSKRFCHSVFRVLDYAMRWVQAKRARGRLTSADKETIARVQTLIDSIPAELVSQRAVDCNEFARALFYLEQHAQKLEQQKREPEDRTKLLEKLQEIYANIDEPDGLEGVAAHLHVLDINQQILSHKKAGRWSAAQTWYEMQLAEKPGSIEIQLELLNCLKQSGHHDVLLNHVEGMLSSTTQGNKIMPFAVEAAWVTRRWESLSKFLHQYGGDPSQDFNIAVAGLFESVRKQAAPQEVTAALQSMREKVASALNTSSTASLQAAHDLMLKCHAVADLELILEARTGDEEAHKEVISLLEGRLAIIGAYFNDKQYLLGLRRAAMELSRPRFTDLDISGLWLSSARLARKSDSLTQSLSAVLHASQLGDDAATIENAKLLWKDKHHRKAIQMLQGAIDRNKFMTQTGTIGEASTDAPGSTRLTPQQKLLTARAQLLLAKWIDAAGQSNASALREKFQQPPKTHATWEKGHYYLGHHYKKLLESEKPLKVDDQSDEFHSGEVAKLVIENYLRSLNAGTKYLYQTLPRILTLWLEMGATVDKPPEGKATVSKEMHRLRTVQLNLLHSVLEKYIHRLPAYIWYTALPQIVARIAHPHQQVFEKLTLIIVKVVEAHPQQALWSMIGVITARKDSSRKQRSSTVLQTLRARANKVDGTAYDIKSLLRAGEKLADQLLLACQNGDFHGNKTVHASLSRDLRFNHKCTPCPLVVPVEATLTATLPTVSEQIKRHKAFSRDVVTIDCFLDDVLVLSSLAKPRRLTARGTDGKNYMLLIKPKDDLRTDQRLMEFNGMINRSLKRDAESSRRQLYIRTYAVVPLNEECGIIEWVPGIKTIRDILLNLYTSRKIHPDYNLLRQLMDEAGQEGGKIRIFTDDVLGRFPPMLQLWFIDRFPNPSSWFSARLRYTRSCAVMSMVGTILGLGDRHGENVNLEEGNGGVFHVDFNCLFDKGKTFAKPETVPFRLTHNMVAAMGIYGYEGPFRKSSELTLSILRQQEETLMTILEAFIYDPTLDLQKDKRAHKRSDTSIRLQPGPVVANIKRKVRGLMAKESIPLSVEGHVDELIKQAVDPRNLTQMYIGWCPFL